MSAAALLAQASAVFEGKIEVGSEALRGACWLARAALEDGVRQALSDRGHDVGDASMKAQLACLESAMMSDDSDLVSKARSAWQGLSDLCHHHAYELTPTIAEVEGLLASVAEICLESAHKSAPRARNASLNE